MNKPISPEAQDFITKMFPCQAPCDSYGVCEGCIENHLFCAGYNFGYRACENKLLIAMEALEAVLNDEYGTSINAAKRVNEALIKLKA